MFLGSLRACSVHTFRIPLQELPGSIPLFLCEGWCSESPTFCPISDLPHCLLFPILLLLRTDSFVRSSVFFLHSWIHHIPLAKGAVLSLCPPGFLLRGRSSTHHLPFASSILQGRGWAGLLCYDKLLVEAVICLVGNCRKWKTPFIFLPDNYTTG